MQVVRLAGETDFTVWVRRRLRTDAALRAALLGPDEHRLPMVFQYNPLETYLETTADGELLRTINSTAVLTPKLRYGVGDEDGACSVASGRGVDDGAASRDGVGDGSRVAYSPSAPVSTGTTNDLPVSVPYWTKIVTRAPGSESRDSMRNWS